MSCASHMTALVMLKRFLGSRKLIAFNYHQNRFIQVYTTQSVITSFKQSFILNAIKMWRKYFFLGSVQDFPVVNPSWDESACWHFRKCVNWCLPGKPHGSNTTWYIPSLRCLWTVVNILEVYFKSFYKEGLYTWGGEGGKEEMFYYDY